MLSFGGAVTLRGALRRITLGAGITGGGLHSSTRPVIPAGVSTPFSQTNLQNQIRYKYSYAPGWSAARSLYIEHDVGFFHDGSLQMFEYGPGGFACANPPSGCRDFNGPVPQSLSIRSGGKIAARANTVKRIFITHCMKV